MKTDKKKKNVLFAFLILISPIFSFGLGGRFEKKQLGPYKISLSQEFQTDLGALVIKKGKETAFKEVEFGNHYYFGNTFDKILDGPDIYSGRNITGNGIPNLVISNWTGGAHCCHFLYIFELGTTLKKITSVEANSSSIRLVDLDHDGFPEIEFLDGAIDYQFAAFAYSPGGRVVLKFQKDHYEVATHLMKVPTPSPRKIKAIKNKIKISFEKEDSPNLPYDFLNFMMKYSYSGHFDLALKIADEVWPTKKPGLAKFKEDFTQALRGSSYWKVF